jgi:hypothetical protein
VLTVKTLRANLRANLRLYFICYCVCFPRLFVKDGHRACRFVVLVWLGQGSRCLRNEIRRRVRYYLAANKLSTVQQALSSLRILGYHAFVMACVYPDMARNLLSYYETVA